jgi:hypothetical protein
MMKGKVDGNTTFLRLNSRALKWYMKAIEPRLQGQAFTLGQVRLKFIVEFKLPQSKKQVISKLWEIQKGEGESSWEYNQKFKDDIGRLVHPIHEDH